MHFVVRWPDGQETACYSPSLVIHDHFHEGERYPMADFLHRSAQALDEASERVRAKYGYACSAAMDQLARIQAAAARFAADPGAEVLVVRFTD